VVKVKQLLHSIDKIPGLKLPPEIQAVFRGVRSISVCPIEGRIDPRMARKIVRELSELDPKIGVLLLIDSGGGHISSASGIAAVVGCCANRIVAALVTGECKSAAVDIYLAIPKKRRFALPGSWFMFHSHSTRFTINGQFDLGKMTIDGFTQEMILEKVELLLHEAAEVEKRRMQTFEHYIKQLADDPQAFMRLNHSFSTPTAKEIGLVGTVVSLLAE